jgi:hypothetical protein
MSLITLLANPTILSEVTICPGGRRKGFTAIYFIMFTFGPSAFWLESWPLFTLGFFTFLAFVMIEPRTAMQVFRFFTLIKFRAIYFRTSLGHYRPLIDKVGLNALAFI